MTSFEPTPTGDESVDVVFKRLQQAMRGQSTAVDAALAGLSTDIADGDSATLAVAVTAQQQAQGIFFQTFEDPVEADWNIRRGSGTVTYPTNGVVGGKAFRAVGEVWIAYPGNIPFDPARLYRFRARARLVTAPADPAKDFFYFGFEGVAADGTTLVNTVGADSYSAQHYAGSWDMGAYTLGEWQELTAYCWGVAASGSGSMGVTPQTAGKAHQNVRYMRPMFILNYDTGDGIMEIDYLSIEVITEDPEISALNVQDGPALVAANQAASIFGQPFTSATIASLMSGSAITETQIQDDAITTPKIAANQIVGGHIQAGVITGDKIDANTITAANIASGTITTDEIAAGTILASDIGANQITSSLIAADQILASHIAAGQVDTAELAAGAVTTTKLDALAVTAAKLDAGAVTAGKIAVGGVSGSTQIANGIIVTSHMTANTINGDRIQAGTLAANKITAGSITATQIASNTILAGNIAAGAVDTSELAADAVTANELAANAVYAGAIQAGAVTAAKIQAGSIDTDHLAAGAVTAAKIAANTITGSQITGNTLSAIFANLGTITAGSITGVTGTFEGNLKGSPVIVEGVGEDAELRVYSSSGSATRSEVKATSLVYYISNAVEARMIMTGLNPYDLNIDASGSGNRLILEADTDVQIRADDTCEINIDYDNNQTTEAFEIRANGSTLCFQVQEDGDVLIGDNSTTASRTDNMLWLPICAGAPTGGVSSVGGRRAMVYDYSNKRIWVRDSAAWYYVQLTT